MVSRREPRYLACADVIQPCRSALHEDEAFVDCARKTRIIMLLPHLKIIGHYQLCPNYSGFSMV